MTNPLNEMSRERERRSWIEALHKQGVRHKELLAIIRELGKLSDRDNLIDLFRAALQVEPRDVDDCVLFENLALRFDDEGQLQDLYMAAEGSTKMAEVTIGTAITGENDT